ncbi:MAG: hypothetical protein KF778_08330 [Rhodocyclaceae bacterium]|nr:hypothetical protein [Rhodocyclaceae bacterium]MBX3668393.1 hypothetical protein [Rhodocyclaceae bacterium]
MDELPVQASASAVRTYLHDVLGLTTHEAKPWARASELPYFLSDAFEFSELELLGQPVVLAQARAYQPHSVGEVRIWMEKVQALTGQAAVYVTDALASYERKRLIEQKVAFIVPGNQLYIPYLGLDLREYFRRRPVAAAETLSPSAQAILLAALLQQPWQAEFQPSRIGSGLGYSAMTVSRATKELVAIGLATAYQVGRSHWLRIEQGPREIWARVQSVARSPVQRNIWVTSNTPVPANARLAGPSALARFSMLSAPRVPVVALDAAAWKLAADAGVRESPESGAATQEWQIWRYSPALVPNAATVDPLSLTLSLRDNADDRIQIALDELQEQLPW